MNRKYLLPSGINFKLCKWSPKDIIWMNILPAAGSVKNGWDKFIQEKEKVTIVISYPNNIPKTISYKPDPSELKNLKPLITTIQEEYEKLYCEAKTDIKKKWMITGRRYEDLVLRDILIDLETYEIFPVVY